MSVKLKGYPGIQQLGDWDCGVAALQSLLLYYGKHAKYSDLSLLLEAGQDGVTPDKMKNALGYYGIRFSPMNNNLELVKSSLDDGHPSLVLIQHDRDMYTMWEEEWKYGHWVAIIGYTKRSVTLADPGDGKASNILEREFRKRWHDIGHEQYALITHGVS